MSRIQAFRKEGICRKCSWFGCNYRCGRWRAGLWFGVEGLTNGNVATMSGLTVRRVQTFRAGSDRLGLNDRGADDRLWCGWVRQGSVQHRSCRCWKRLSDRYIAAVAWLSMRRVHFGTGNQRGNRASDLAGVCRGCRWHRDIWNGRVCGLNASAAAFILTTGDKCNSTNGRRNKYNRFHGVSFIACQNTQENL